MANKLIPVSVVILGMTVILCHGFVIGKWVPAKEKRAIPDDAFEVSVLDNRRLYICRGRPYINPNVVRVGYVRQIAFRTRLFSECLIGYDNEPHLVKEFEVLTTKHPLREKNDETYEYNWNTVISSNEVYRYPEVVLGVPHGHHDEQIYVCMIRRYYGVRKKIVTFPGHFDGRDYPGNCSVPFTDRVDEYLAGYQYDVNLLTCKGCRIEDNM